MKLTTALILFTAMHVYAKTSGQVITYSARNAKLEQVFRALEQQTGYGFFYQVSDLKNARPVSVELKNLALPDALKMILKNQSLDFVIDGKTVFITPQKKEEGLTQGIRPGLDQAQARTIDVRGTIKDENGKPVAGASVQVKGNTKKGTAADDNGYFELKGVDENAVLIISALNIETFEVRVNKRADLAVLNAKVKVEEADEVVVNTGYQQLRPNEVTGSVVHINNRLLNRSVSTDVLSRLRGISSGLLMLGGSGVDGFPNAGNIVIRGYSTILANKRPLIVVDNFPYEGEVANFNPNDVENITILKDAGAASIWGSKAANGVIVITTKKGKYNAKLKVSLISNISLLEKPDLFYAPTLNSSDYIDIEAFLFNKGYYNSGITSSSRPALSPVVEILLKRRNGQITSGDSVVQLAALKNVDIRNDILKYYYNKPLKQQYAINLSGGNSNQRYFVSFGYDYNINNASNYNRYSLNANDTYSLLDGKLEIATGVLLSQTNIKNFAPNYTFTYPYGKLADERGGPLPLALRRQGYIDTAGAGKLLDWNFYPLNERQYMDDNSTSLNYLINVGLKYNILKALSFEAKFQYGRNHREDRDNRRLQTYYTRDYINGFTSINWAAGTIARPVPLGGILDMFKSVYIFKNLRGQVNYAKTWGPKHKFVAIAGADVSDAKTNSNSYRYYGYNEGNGTSIPVDYVNGYKNYVTGISSLILNNQSFTDLKDRFVSAFTNAAYTFENLYTVSVSGRKDGANIFGTSSNNKWKPLWSAGILWNVSKERFYNLKWLPDLRLKFTYGFQGNVDNSVSSLLTINYQTNTNDWNQLYGTIRNPPNSDLRWEKVRMINIGLEYGTKRDRVSGSVEYFKKSGVDLIGFQELAPSSGLVSYKGNTANMKGEGIDLVINTLNLDKTIKWSSSILFSYARDWVTEYKIPITNIGSYIGGGLNPIVGRPVTALYSYKWIGLESDTGDPLGYLDGHESKDYTKILASVNLNDMVYHGPKTPTFFGGLLNTINYKQFSVSANIVYKFGYFYRRTSINYFNLFSGLSTDRGHFDYINRWQKSGDENSTNVPSLKYPANNNRDQFYNFSEVLVERGDHIRLQDVRIEYSLNRKQMNKLPFQSARLYIYISNIGVLWKANKSGIDPDYVPTNYYTSSLPGRTFAGGMQIEF